MTSFTNYESIKRRETRKGRGIPKVESVGVIITGTIPDLDEKLVEKHISENYDISNLKEINTVGKKEPTFKYVNRFAKKYGIKVNAFRLETYQFDEWDLYVKRNSIITYRSDSIVIIHGGEVERLITWHALSVGVRTHQFDGGCVFVNLARERIFDGLENKVHELLKIPFKYALEDKDRFMEQSFFELNAMAREKFVEYLSKGQQMSFEEVMFNLVKVYLDHPDKDFYNGHASISDRLMLAMFWYYKPDFFDEEGLDPKNGAFLKYIQEEINPDFYERSSRREADVNYVLFYHFWYGWEYMMEDMISIFSFKGNQKVFAALCFAQWISLKYYRGIRD